MTARTGLVHLDPDKLKRRLLQAGISKTAISLATGLSRATIDRAFAGQGIFNSTAQRLVKQLGIERVEEVVLWDNTEASQGQSGDALVAGEWRIDEYLGPTVTASNELQYRICRMRHEFVPERLGRGKWYDLRHLNQSERDRRREHLVRHSRVCDRLKNHPTVATNFNSQPGPVGDTWWVVDEWLDGPTLAAQLDVGPVEQARLPRLMREIAEGLKALHQANIMFRELAPSRVILAGEKGRAVLTEFELAKLLDKAPSVSADWPDDPYRAPEIGGPTVDYRADLYSWARIFVHAATGELPEQGEEEDSLTQVDVPKALWRLVLDSLSPGPSDRPESLDLILRAVENWSA